MQCTKCGSINKKDRNVCQECGMPLNSNLEIESTISLTPIEVEEDYGDIKVTAAGPLLIVKKGPSVGHNFSLDKAEVSLGRDPGSDIFLDDITVSRRHAKILVSENQVSVMDVGSLNGTYVNQERIESEKALESDDELQIGKFKLIFLSKI